MSSIIKVEGVGKLYRIGAVRAHGESLRESLGNFIKKPLGALTGNAEARREELWALKDVSFEVTRGEIIGFIGSNGAGKSTLLKILSRITEPTKGRVELRGRVGSLLEVGTGFHPELTGRENIFLNGAILGMRRDEIERKFDEIVAFSEIGRFIDTAVKYYSSGMYMRLAFAIAAHLDPEILIVDEVLAVGDADFQRKCLGKIGEVTSEGRTVLFVSHNMVAVQSLCDRVLWLNQGRVIEEGPPTEVIADYFKSTSGADAVSEETWDNPSAAPGNDMARLRRVWVRPEEGWGETLTMDTPFRVAVEFWNRQPGARLHVTLHFITEHGIIAFTSGSVDDSPWRNDGMPAGLFRCTCYVPGRLLNAGRHRLDVLVVQNTSSVILQHRGVVSFDIVDLREREGSYFGREPGVVAPILKWATDKVEVTAGENLVPRQVQTPASASSD
jgi:lipopolysaccharide transport system ATP-binding protein